jgi:hypothetical protein
MGESYRLLAFSIAQTEEHFKQHHSTVVES